MSAPQFPEIIETIFRELVQGSSDPQARTYVVNQGDQGLFASLDRLSAAAASAAHGGASIAAHVDHLLYGFMLINRWVDGSPPPWPDMDWTASWRRTAVTEPEWRALRDELRREATKWADALRTPQVLEAIGPGWMTGSVAHLAYHVGAIRQIDRTARGPSAEDEAEAQA
jgi:hypothetical protein